MNNSKKIEVNKSTLISLKAELLRKQDEVNKAKLQPKNQMQNFVPTSKFATDDDEEADKPERPKSKSHDPEEIEALKKSREALEKKSQLYDHLSKTNTRSENEEFYLVDFNKKNSDSKSKECVDAKSDNDYDKTNYDINSDDDDEWVDYVDCLGRTRRCLKTDLEGVKKIDKSLMDSLKPKVPESVSDSMRWTKESDEPKSDETIDPFKEMLHKQWEEKEQELMKKDTVYYEDVRFNEARQHGVGYYAFSGDEEVRAKQQEELRLAHEETEKARAAAELARVKRDEALQKRVKAARARQRARAGLPPEEDEPEPTIVLKLLDFVEEQKKVSSEKSRLEREARELEAQKEREKFVREWDLNKEGIDKHRIMSQEEWVDKKREERIGEFAPLQTPANKKRNKPHTFDKKGFVVEEKPADLTWRDVRPTTSYLQKNDETEEDRSLYFTTKRQQDDIKRKYYDPSVNRDTQEIFEAKPIVDECENLPSELEEAKERGGVEIEPPPTFEYFGPVNQKRRKCDYNRVNVEEGFIKGLERLERHEIEKNIRKEKATIDDL